MSTTRLHKCVSISGPHLNGKERSAGCCAAARIPRQVAFWMNSNGWTSEACATSESACSSSGMSSTDFSTFASYFLNNRLRTAFNCLGASPGLRAPFGCLAPSRCFRAAFGCLGASRGFLAAFGCLGASLGSASLGSESQKTLGFGAALGCLGASLGFRAAFGCFGASRVFKADKGASSSLLATPNVAVPVPSADCSTGADASTGLGTYL